MVLLIMMTLLSVIGGYIIASVLLFKYPTIIHRKKELKFRCRHISHRGGAAENLENTLSAFKHAVSVGTDMLEIDLQLTKDGKVVVSHDNNLLRTTGHDVNISDNLYDELPLLKHRIPVDFVEGHPLSSGSDRKIPLLEDVYKQFPGLAINIDIKTDNDDLISQVARLTRDYQRESYTVWGNYSDLVTKKCLKENPAMPILFSFKRVLMLILLTYSGLLPFVNLQESCLEVFLPRILYKNTNGLLQQKKSFKYIVWVSERLLMRKAIFEHLEKRGIQTYLWVLNEDNEFEQALKLGATGIMTDYPTRLRDFLNERHARAESQ